MLIYHKGHTDTIQVYSVTVMTHVKALQAGYSSQGTSEPITPVLTLTAPVGYMKKTTGHGIINGTSIRYRGAVSNDGVNSKYGTIRTQNKCV